MPFQKRRLPSRQMSSPSQKPLPLEDLSLTAIAPIEATKSKLSEPTAIDQRLIWVMAVACGLSVANLIYVQSLLVAMGRSFAASADQIGFVLTLGLLGYAVGSILIAPLGDKYNQRSLIVIMLCAVAIALAAMAQHRRSPC